MRQLKDGETVTLVCGTTVHPDDVLEPAEPNYPFIGKSAFSVQVFTFDNLNYIFVKVRFYPYLTK